MEGGPRLRRCLCVQCLYVKEPDPQTGESTAGRWVSEQTYELHNDGPRTRPIPGFSSEALSAKRWTGFVEPYSAANHGACTSRSDLPEGESQVSVPANTLSVGAEMDSAHLTQRIDTCLRSLRASLTDLKRSVALVQFQKPPHLNKDYVPADNRGPSTQHLKLDPKALPNAPFLAYWVELSHAEKLVTQNSQDTRIQSKVQIGILSDAIIQHRKQYSIILAEEWKRQFDTRLQLRFVDTERYHRDTLRLLSPNILALYLMVAALYLLSNVSQMDCGFMLSVLRMVMVNQAETSTSIDAQASASSMLTGVDRVIQLLDIYPSSTAYVCCEVCYCLYWFDPASPSPNFPSHCSNQTAQGRCNAPLRKSKNTRNGESKTVPVREFLYRDAMDYISQMMARSDIADWLYDDPVERPSDPDNAWDIWDAPALRDFRFIDGTRFTSSTEESRLVFSLNFDGFNPGGNREAGKKTKVGAIYLVCLNLPPAIRYNIENVYLVGIIPGPQGPSTDEINHLIKPLIDDFIVLWRTGAYLSRTSRHSNGIRVRGAIIPLVCDLPAARQMSGAASYMHTDFCSECKQKKSDINNLDSASWEPRTWAEHKSQAEQWRDASNTKARENLIKAHGVRWSELLRLPYWDPTRFTLIDSMHAFYLRIFQHHIRNIWGMDVKIDDGEGIMGDRSAKAPDERTLQKAQDVLRHGSMTDLRKLSRPTLVELSRDAKTLPVRGSKESLLKHLRQYRIDQGWFRKNGAYIPEDEEGHISESEGVEGTSIGDADDQIQEDSDHGEESDTGDNRDGEDDDCDDDYEGDDWEDGGDDCEDDDEDDDNSCVDNDEELANEDGAEFTHHGDSSNEDDDGDSSHVDGDSERSYSTDESELEGIPDAMDEDEDEDEAVEEDEVMDVDSKRAEGNWQLLRDETTNTLDFLTYASPSKVKTAVKEDLVKVFHDHVAPYLPATVVQAAPGFVKETLISYILEERRRRGIGEVVGKRTRTRVLGRQTLKEIRSDMRKLQRPSWQANGPSQPGEAKRGKFTADQWRTFCTVNLPVTLIRLWGGAQEDSIERRRLDNFMYLVTAVKLATMNAMNEQRILEYEYNMRRYLETLLELYPATQLTPYQHLSLHFGRHLRMFGPVHAWRCFPFERYNFLIQSIPTNNKFSELEKTMFRKFSAAQRLRAIFCDCKGLPEAIRPMLSHFQKNYDTKFQANLSELFVDGENWRGGLQSNWDVGQLDSLSRETHHQLEAWLREHDPDCAEIPAVAHFHHAVYRHGRKLTTFSKHRNDSQVVFLNHSGGRTSGTIKTLFSHKRQRRNGESVAQAFAIIVPYEELEVGDEDGDLYRRYHPDVAGRLVYNRLTDRELVIPVASILSHFACQVQTVPGVQRECLLVQPLNRN